MSEEPAAVPAEPAPSLPRRMLARVWARVQQLRKPLLLLAGTGAVLGGLAGWWNAYQAVKGARTAANSTPAALPGTAAERSLAVLPFVNLSADAADSAFAEGLGEELVNLLSRVKGLRVTARRSALQFKGQTLPTTEMASRLQASYLVDGTVRRAGGQVRIGAQLIDGRSGSVLWSGQFEREMKDVLAAQSDLALQIARSLQLPLDAATLAGSGTRNMQAWQLFMQAQKLPSGTGQREPLYQRALALDPGFARVHVERAEEVMAGDWRGRDARTVSAQIVPHLEAALRADPNSAHAYGRLATAAALSDDLEAMRRYARKALELDSGDMPGHNWTAELALQEGRVEDSLALRRTMTELEPLDPLAYLFLAQRLRMAQRPADALAAVERALLLKPDWREAQVEQAQVLLALGRRDEALALARRTDWVEVMGMAGSTEDLQALRRRSDLNEHRLAALAFFDGRYDAFFDHFEKDHSDLMDRNAALFDPMLDRVREHPRFKAWLARFGMQQAQERATAWRAANPAPR